MKPCKKCGVKKPLTDFYKHKTAKDGHATQCKRCHKLNYYFECRNGCGNLCSVKGDQCRTCYTTAEHGDVKKYWQGCRCEPCKAAQAAYRRQTVESGGGLRESIRTKDYAAIQAFIIENVDKSGDCWLFQRYLTEAGYARTVGHLVHRLSYMAFNETEIGSEPVHHKCAVRNCVNPDHLQLVSHRENTAEMLQRNYYLERIAALEEAIREVAPDSAVLNEGAST